MCSIHSYLKCIFNMWIVECKHVFHFFIDQSVIFIIRPMSPYYEQKPWLTYAPISAAGDDLSNVRHVTFNFRSHFTQIQLHHKV